MSRRKVYRACERDRGNLGEAVSQLAALCFFSGGLFS